MNATIRFIVWGTIPLGRLLGGTLANWLGNRAALRACAAGACLAPISVLASPLRHMRDKDPASAEASLAPDTAGPCSRSARLCPQASPALHALTESCKTHTPESDPIPDARS
jgi:hypothetical protein